MEHEDDITLESIASETLEVTLESDLEWSIDASFSSVELVAHVQDCAVTLASGRSSTPKKSLQKPLPRPQNKTLTPVLPGKLLQSIDFMWMIVTSCSSVVHVL